MALFAPLGGTSVAASPLIGTHQLKDGAVTSSKIGHHQVKTGNIANNAVTSAKVADGSLTAADVAPNTFLPANGTAANSKNLGGRPSTDYMQGRGGMVFNRITVPAGQSQLLLSFGFGDLIGKCAAGGIPQVAYQSDVSSVNLVDWVTDYGSRRAPRPSTPRAA